MRDERLSFFAKLCDFGTLKGLEIGPLTSPVVVPEDLEDGGEIAYLDHMSTVDLKEKYKDDQSVKTEDIVDIDFICPEGDIVSAVNGNMFDYVVASHVFEHSPNALKFLCDIEKILNPEGMLFLVVPDKRFTFDINRPETTFGELLEKFQLSASRPSISAVYDHFALARHSNAHNIWHGIKNKHDLEPLTSLSKAWEFANLVAVNKKYFDVHVNIFTPASFFEILKQAIIHHLISLEMHGFQDTSVGQLEFMVVLKKPSKLHSDNSRLRCLETIPKLEMESVLSPYMPQVKALSSALEQVSETSMNQQRELMQLREQIGSQNRKIDELKDRINSTQLVLDRRSVKIAVGLVDKFFSIIRKK